MSWDKDKMLKEMDEWFESEEGKKSLETMIISMEESELLEEKLEKESTLEHFNGSKVLRYDLVTSDFEYEDQLYRDRLLIVRINEDNTVDFLIDGWTSHRLNSCVWDNTRYKLLSRETSEYIKSPFDYFEI